MHSGLKAEETRSSFDLCVAIRSLRSRTDRARTGIGRGMCPGHDATPHVVRTEDGGLHLVTRLALVHDAIATPCGALNTAADLP